MRYRLAGICLLVCVGTANAQFLRYQFFGPADGFNDLGPFVDPSILSLQDIQPSNSPMIVGNTATYSIVDLLIEGGVSAGGGSGATGNGQTDSFNTTPLSVPPPFYTNHYAVTGGSITISDNDNGVDRFNITIEATSQADPVFGEAFGEFNIIHEIDFFASVSDGSAGPVTSLNGLTLPDLASELDPTSFDSTLIRTVITEVATGNITTDYSGTIDEVRIPIVPEPATALILTVGAGVLMKRKR